MARKTQMGDRPSQTLVWVLDSHSRAKTINPLQTAAPVRSRWKLPRMPKWRYSGQADTTLRCGEAFCSGCSGDSAAAECSKSIEAMLGSSIPSARLEHDAQRFGFLERGLSGSAIFSPQQMQILGFIRG